jgi:RND superfamily putative drug exporter
MFVVVWIGLVAVAGGFAAKLQEVQQNDAQAFLPSNAESTRAFEIYEENFANADTTSAIVVYAREGGLTDADRSKVEQDRTRFARLAKGQVSPVVPSADGAALLLNVPLETSQSDFTPVRDAVNEIRDIAPEGAAPGLTVHVTGAAGISADLNDAFAGTDSTLLLATVAVVTIILLLVYRSPFLWLVPLIAVGVSSQVANGVVYLLAEHAGVLVNGQSLAILPVLVFGVGTDYALLLIARYREELRRHEERRVAMAIALRRSLPAILASASTVVIALGCLLAATMNSTRGLGPVLIIGIVAAFLTMSTLLPALLVILGRWVFWPRVPRYQAEVADTDALADHGVWSRLAERVRRRPRLIWTASAVVLIGLALGLTSLSTGLPREKLFLTEVDSTAGQEILAAHFPAGSSAPLDIFARASAEPQVRSAATATVGVARVAPPEPGGDWVHLTVVMTDAPSSPEAEATVDRLRDAVHAVPGADAVVSGATAVTVDTNRASQRDERLIIPLILLVVFLVLATLLRAVVMAVLLLASVVLSFAAALGLSSLIFNALGHPQVDKTLPLFGFLFLVALGVDYTIFLMTRAREEVAAVGHESGVVRALGVTGAVITSAGLVLAATFAVLAVLPLVTSMQQGVLVAVGVLLDASIVRVLLVPALALDVGPRSWWPSRLTVPRSDVSPEAADRLAVP